MNEQNGRQGKPLAALLAAILIVLVSAALVWTLWQYAGAGWRTYAFEGLGVVLILWLLWELRGLIRFIRISRQDMARHVKGKAAAALVLLSEDGTSVRSWDLRNQTGLLIGRSHENADVDVDLSGTEYFSLISDEHAVLNYTGKGWMLADAGSKNGTAILRRGSNRKLQLAPSEPVPIVPGDTIYIAEETALAVK